MATVSRFGKVVEVAAVVVILAGNGYSTGQTISVNGGWYMTCPRFRPPPTEALTRHVAQQRFKQRYPVWCRTSNTW